MKRGNPKRNPKGSQLKPGNPKGQSAKARPMPAEGCQTNQATTSQGCTQAQRAFCTWTNQSCTKVMSTFWLVTAQPYREDRNSAGLGTSQGLWAHSHAMWSKVPSSVLQNMCVNFDLNCPQIDSAESWGSESSSKLQNIRNHSQPRANHKICACNWRPGQKRKGQNLTISSAQWLRSWPGWVAQVSAQLRRKVKTKHGHKIWGEDWWWGCLQYDLLVFQYNQDIIIRFC